MNFRKIIFLGVSFVLIGWIAYLNLVDDAERDAAQLLKKQSPPDAWTTAVPNDDRDSVAGGLSRTLPPDLVVDRAENGDWYVHKPGSEHALSLPYPPTEIPAVSTGLTNVTENPGFLGAGACQPCHVDRHAGFVQTAHHRTSAPASEATIAGSFDGDRRMMNTQSPYVSFEMLNVQQRPIQRVSFFNWQCDIPFDVVTGSSKLGQTYLYWHQDELFQMSVSYVTEVDGWTNSPGFSDGDAVYSRPVTARCLECHSTWADLRRSPNHFTPDSLILGISCERCHGPGRDHVNYHQQHPDTKTARFITQPATLPRERQLDICGQCHFGNPKLKGAPYQFRPGDQLSQYYHPPEADLAGGVHSSNQLMRLSKSPCFQQTEMTCTDCHNPHQSERGNRKLFSQRCLKCHEAVDCGMEPRLGERLGENCIDCHMPASASESMFMDTLGGKVFPPLRDHHIRVDQDLTKAYLKSIGL